jgi:hypothetical protein
MCVYGQLSFFFVYIINMLNNLFGVFFFRSLINNSSNNMPDFEITIDRTFLRLLTYNIHLKKNENIRLRLPSFVFSSTRFVEKKIYFILLLLINRR